MQRALGFKPVSADDAQQQRDSVAAKWKEEHPEQPAAAAAEQPRRKPGRPPRKRELIAPAESDAPPPQRARTGLHTNWFSSPYINDVLQMLERHSFNFKRAVAALKLHAPDGRYEKLSDSTVRAWFEKGTHTLLPSFQLQLDAGKALGRNGRPALMTEAVEDECKEVLLRLRDSGLPVNSHVIRWALRAVFKARAPALLQEMHLSQQWISFWVRSKLQWRWRQRTTAASKLPNDWEQLGVQMAKRVAYWMGMHNVRAHTQLRPVDCDRELTFASALLSADPPFAGRQRGSDRSAPPACCFVHLREERRGCSRCAWC